MPTFRITLGYDGTGFVGWQRQAVGVSIQGLIEDALRRIDGREVTVTGAGRTDAGVHALGQVAAFTIARDLTPDAVVRALNAHLPHEVRVLTAAEAPSTFHPRFGARTKTYRYRICNADVMSPFEHGFAWHVPGPLDVDAMRAAAKIVEGRHDFAAFQATGSSAVSTVREVFSLRIADCGLRIGEESTVESAIQSAIRNPQSAILCSDVSGSGFLRHMVRIIVGSLVEVGRGRRRVEWIADVIASRSRTAAGPTAPPDGLFLVRVEYGDALAAGS